MSQTIDRSLNQLARVVDGHLSLHGDQRYAKATGIWARPIGAMPRAVVHCRTPHDVIAALRVARECGIRCRYAAAVTTGRAERSAPAS